MNAKRTIFLLAGPGLLIFSIMTLSGIFGTTGAQAIGVSLWMIFWWITRPVHISITALIPAVANAFLNMVPMTDVISQYASESIVLVFASGLIILPWAAIGLDRRIALKVLSIVGPSMKSQMAVWLFATIAFSTVLPNIAVVTLFCPIAVAMLKAAGYDDISTAAPAVPIMLAISWGVSLGGGG
ncbi:MAG: SLC13 family permease, partial [Oscillospiraceae bacterium]